MIGMTMLQGWSSRAQLVGFEQFWMLAPTQSCILSGVSRMHGFAQTLFVPSRVTKPSRGIAAGGM